jgi:hypothetical protein
MLGAGSNALRGEAAMVWVGRVAWFAFWAAVIVVTVVVKKLFPPEIDWIPVAVFSVFYTAWCFERYLK